jgi:1-acyl-sn-glycerol-3-phosphate acyltransferase
MKNTKPTAPYISDPMLTVFLAYCRRFVRRRFHALRVSKLGLPARDPDRPMVVYLNHAAWWDPIVCLLLSREFFPGCHSFAPIDAAMLERYAFFRHLGFFGIEPGTQRGALTLLRTAHNLLGSPQNALWLTPQGRFTDVRERPIGLMEGLGALAVREPDAAFVPLAIEYTFWSEPRPEILVSFGEPITPGVYPVCNAAEWTRLFADRLTAAQEDLAAASFGRDPAAWRTLHGRSGVSAVYDSWRWLRAQLRGESFSAEHHVEAGR